jgi:hypothetical protein
MTQYKLRPKTLLVEAIQFEYSTDGIIKLREFCGDRLLCYRKNRNPGAIGVAEINPSPDYPLILDVPDGSFIIRKPYGWFEVMDEVEFVDMYEPL